ncbi:MAG TPA: OB-fold domain-containing protein [Mycobacteriales bacterium]|nr:OB-fold domain-containing protein [Mycobacteriales bacterium]HWA65392.1 OB-fold domain-containing protein [Mycobacteriales bacterium]
MSDRPVPVPDEVSAPHWQAAANHQLTIARCSECGSFSHPPDVVCEHCGSVTPQFRFMPVDGAGVVRSWTVVRQAFLPGFDTPYRLVDVELDAQAGLRLVARLLDDLDVQLTIGARVRVSFEDIADGVSVPAFRLAP